MSSGRGVIGSRRAVVWAATALLLGLAGISQSAPSGPPEQRFREATALMRGGDIPGAIAVYRELAASGHESANLYWNWAQGAATRGRGGEALWALLRAREVGPADPAVEREIERLRSSLQLDPAELNPVPTAALARTVRRWHLGPLAMLLLAASLLLAAIARRRVAPAWPKIAAWTTFGLGFACAIAAVGAANARATSVVTARQASLLDAASPSARTVATLREGEVVPILDQAGGFLRIQDSSGARGWARETEVWALNLPPTGLL